MNKTISPYKIAASLKNLWAPQMITEIENTCIKVARIKGELGWHTHENEDKIFFILKGTLKIEMKEETVFVSEGEMYIVQKGINNNPSADEECHIMFIEPKT